MDAALTPEGRDSTIGDEPTETGNGPEELDDVTNDGSAGDGSFGDGETRDTLDTIMGDSGKSSEDEPLDVPIDDDDPPSGNDGSDGATLPGELTADAMGRPLDGSMNDDDQGMQSAGDSLGE